jgi:two-component system, LytTR family, sensor kinase
MVISNIAKHAVFWVAYSMISLATIIISNTDAELHYVVIFITYGLGISCTYTTALFILPRYFAVQKYIKFLIAFFLLWVIFLFLDIILEVYFERWYYNMPPARHIKWFNFCTIIFWIFCQYSLLGIGLYFLNSSVKKERRLRIAEKQKFEFENAFLRAQINPHFLYNTLGYVYNQVEPHDEDAAKVVNRLSQLMRHSLQETDANGLIALSDEITAIGYLVDIYQRRFSQSHIRFHCSGNPNNHRIIPAVLLTLAENTFKHGDLGNEQYPITISLHITNNQLNFSTHNKKITRMKDGSHNLGLPNIIQRLQQVYGSQHQFTIDNQPEFYTCTLAIELCKK